MRVCVIPPKWDIQKEASSNPRDFWKEKNYIEKRILSVRRST